MINYLKNFFENTEMTNLEYIIVGVLVIIIATILITFFGGIGKHGKWLYNFVKKCKKNIENKNQKRKIKKEKLKIKKDFTKNGYILHWNIIHTHMKKSDLYNEDQNLPLKFINIRIVIDKNTDEIVFVLPNKTKQIRIHKKYNIYRNKSLFDTIIDEIYRENEYIKYYTSELKTKYDDKHTFTNYKKLFEEIHDSSLHDFLIEKLNENNRYKTI
jgi:hypothetical protein